MAKGADEPKARPDLLGAQLARLRRAKGLSLRQVEEATDGEVSNAYLSQLGPFRFPIFEKRGSYSAYNTGWFVVSPLQEAPFSITPCTSSFEDGCSRLAITAHSLLPGRPGEGVMRIAIDEGRQIGTWSADRARMLEPAQRNALIERFAARRFPKKRARNPCARHWMSMRPYANMFLTGLHSSGAL